MPRKFGDIPRTDVKKILPINQRGLLGNESSNNVKTILIPIPQLPTTSRIPGVPLPETPVVITNPNPVKDPKKILSETCTKQQEEEQITEEEIQKLKRHLAPKNQKSKKAWVDERQNWEKFIESAYTAIQMVQNSKDVGKTEDFYVSF